MDIPLGEAVHFDVVTSTATGAAADADSTPTWAVYCEATDTALLGGNFTKRTGLTGDYRGTFTASAANGFAVGKFYSVIASATVATRAGKEPCLLFRVSAAESTVGVAPATVSGSSLALGPTAVRSTSDIYAVIQANGTAALSARVLHWDGDDIVAADISTITYTIYSLDPDDVTSRVAVDGHEAVALTPASIIYDTVQSDEWASNWNFRHIPVVSANQAFTTPGAEYLVEYTLTPASGQVIIVRFRVRCI